MSEWTCQKCGKVIRENADFCLSCVGVLKAAPAAVAPTTTRYFVADEAPIGTVVQVGHGTVEERLAYSEFRRYLFRYFEQLTSGQTGWGVDFNAWLEMSQGWRHLGRRKYERVMSMEEMITSESGDQIEA